MGRVIMLSATRRAASRCSLSFILKFQVLQWRPVVSVGQNLMSFRLFCFLRPPFLCSEGFGVGCS